MTESKVSRKVILPFIVRMDEHIKAINTIVDEMPDCSAKKSLETTMKNFNKKYQNYTSASVVVTGEVLSEDEQEMLKAFREKKTLEQTKESEILSDARSEMEETSKKKGKGKK